MRYIVTYRDRSQAYSDRLPIEADSKEEAEQIFWEANGDTESSRILYINDDAGVCVLDNIIPGMNSDDQEAAE